MDFTHELAGDVVVARLAGRLDSGAAQSTEESFARVLAAGANRLAVDLSDLEYISSAGLRVLLVVAKKLGQTNGKIVLFGLGPRVQEVFAISGFDRIFTIQADAAAAVAAAH